jgi:predicted transcriptional regulator
VQEIDLGRKLYETEIKEVVELALDKMAKAGKKCKKESSDSSDDEDLYDRLDELEAHQSWSTKKLSSIEETIQAIHKALCTETGTASVENINRQKPKAIAKSQSIEVIPNGVGSSSESEGDSKTNSGQQSIDREAVEAGKKGKEASIGDIDASEEVEDIEVVRSQFPLAQKYDLGLTKFHVYSSLK